MAWKCRTFPGFGFQRYSQFAKTTPKSGVDQKVSRLANQQHFIYTRGKASFDKSIFFFCLLTLTSFYSCDRFEHNYTLVNDSERTITAYEAKSKTLSNRELFEAFKSTSSINNDTPRTPFIVHPKSKVVQRSLVVFERSFQTKDHLFHLVILDVDSLRVITKKNQPDSTILGKVVLRHFALSKEEMEKNGRIITYKEF